MERVMDWLAAILEILGLWRIGNYDKKGFVLSLLCNITWGYVAIKMELYGLLIVVGLSVVLNIRNYWKWSRQQR
jgi:nicotinamide riboside transporter PnuC